MIGLKSYQDIKTPEELEEEMEDWKADSEHNLELMEGLNNRISELEKENAELKGIKDVATLIRANNDTVVTLMQLNNKLVSKIQQLTKAKEILEELAKMEYAINPPADKVKSLMVKAEQFLKEIEK